MILRGITPPLTKDKLRERMRSEVHAFLAARYAKMGTSTVTIYRTNPAQSGYRFSTQVDSRLDGPELASWIEFVIHQMYNEEINPAPTVELAEISITLVLEEGIELMRAMVQWHCPIPAGKHWPHIPGSPWPTSTTTKPH